MAPKIGKNQQGMLRLLELHGGFWHDKCGWVCVNASNTQRLLRSLEAAGLVTSEEFYGTERLWVAIQNVPFNF